jgi:hypothetical protein
VVQGIYLPEETTDLNGPMCTIPHTNRTTNRALLLNQIGGTCYAYAAISAYYNTCARIMGCVLPNLNEMPNVATYDPMVRFSHYHLYLVC